MVAALPWFHRRGFSLLRLWPTVILLLMCVIASNLWAQAARPAGPTFPELTGRVVDQANVIRADVEAQLTTRLEALETKSSDQVVVATVTSLQGYEIEDYGYRLGRHWQIGQGERLNNGVILLVAPNERKVRIEVGYGLEGVLTDYASGQIIRDQIVPAFKAGDLVGGIVAGVDGIEDIILASPEELAARAKRSEAGGSGPGNQITASGLRNIIFVFVAFFATVIAMFVAVAIVIVGGFSSLMQAQIQVRTGRSGAGASGNSTSNWSSSSSSSSSSASSSSRSFSGGGGSFGGGGASGSW